MSTTKECPVVQLIIQRHSLKYLARYDLIRKMVGLCNPTCMYMYMYMAIQQEYRIYVYSPLS